MLEGGHDCSPLQHLGVTAAQTPPRLFWKLEYFYLKAEDIRVKHPDRYTVTSILPFPSFLYPHVYKETQALALRGGIRL